MVIPLNGVGPNTTGPPPPELEHRFSLITKCLWVMVFSMVGQLVGGLLLGRAWATLLNQMNPLTNIVIGMFLPTSDPYFDRCHKCLLRTVFASCREQCPGGMNCILYFVCFLVYTLVFDALFDGGNTYVLYSFSYLYDWSQWKSQVEGLATCLLILSVLSSLISQLSAAVFGMLAFREARELHESNPEMGMGFGGGQDDGRPLGGSVNPFTAMGGEGRRGDSSADAQQAFRGYTSGRNVGFRPFSGEGHVLGDQLLRS